MTTSWTPFFGLFGIQTAQEIGRRRLPTSLAVAFIPSLVQMILEILDKDLDVAAGLVHREYLLIEHLHALLHQSLAAVSLGQRGKGFALRSSTSS